MNPAIFGMSQLVQDYNRFSGASSAIPAGTANNVVQKGRPIPLKVIEFFLVFNFLEPEDLESLAVVSKIFKDAVWYQWKSRCQNFFPGTELDSVLPATLSFKESLWFMRNIFDESFYARYIGNVDPASQSAKANFLKRCNQSDPCNSTKTIGREYVLMYIPSHIEIDQSDFSLSGAEDPNDSEAPRLIRGKISPGAKLESTTLKVAVTLNNIIELFKHPKTGNPSLCEQIWDQVLDDHGNKRIQAGWVCMRRGLIGRNLSFTDQQALVTKKGVEVSELLPRILFNFMEHSRSKEVGVYPEGKAPSLFARTSTRSNGCFLGCGAGGRSGLLISHNQFVIGGARGGVVVVLPAEVQAISP